MENDGKYSIKMLERIIRDAEVFFYFINKEGEFAKENIKEYVDSLNNCMDIMINNVDTLTESDFYRINYVNSLFDTDKRFDFKTYQAKKNGKITYKVIQLILNNDSVFDKFMNFEDNIKFFRNMPIENYMDVLMSLIEYFEKNGKKLSLPEQDKFNKIMAKYSLIVKRKHELTGELVNMNVNEELKNEVLNGLNVNENPFAFARGLYVNLCKVLKFDFNVVIQNYDTDPETFKKIYNRRPMEISLENNSLVCSTWANIYCSLLNQNGIEARVQGEAHKYVVANVDGTLIKADALKNIESEYGTKISDFVRVQMGVETKGFSCLEEDKNIANDIVYADTLNNIELVDIDTMFKKLDNSYATVMRDDVQKYKYKELLVKLNALMMSSKMANLEAMRYLATIIDYLKENKIYDLGYSYLATRERGNFLCNLIVFYIDNGERQYVMFSKNGIRKVRLEDIKYNVDNKKAKILGKSYPIPGLG